MFFPGLIRKFTALPSLASTPQFKAAQSMFMEQINAHLDGFRTNVEVFHDSHWRIIYREPALTPPITPSYFTLDAAANALLEDLVRLVHPVFKVPHRLVFSQIVWLKPGESVERHVDLQKGFTYTKRFNIILVGNGLKYSVFKGETECVIPVVDGEIFELNNRAGHGSINVGTGVTAMLVLDFVERTVQPITEYDRVTPSPVLEGATVGLPTEIQDY